MTEWFKDEEVQELLTRLQDRLCTLERMGGEVYGSMLVFIPTDERLPVLFAREGKPSYPYEHLRKFDIEMAVKQALTGRLPD